MRDHPFPFPPDEWEIRETYLDLDRLDWSGSIFALSNGHLGLRGNFEEGEPVGTPGTYLNSVHELRPLPYAEPGFGYPESGETMINVTDGQILRLLVDDEPFDVRYGELISHERVLDLRSGCLHRSVEWRSPAGQRIRVRSTRLVSLTQRAIAAIRYEVEAIDDPASVVVQSELVVNEPLPDPRASDPRVAAVMRAPLLPEHHSCGGTAVTLVHRVARSHIGVAAAMDHEVHAPDDTQTTCDSSDDLGRFTVTTELPPGERLTIVKLLAYGWSTTRSTPALRDQVDAALTAARLVGWEGLVAEQRALLDGYWSVADVEIEGDPEVRQGVRFGLFQVLQAGLRAEGRPIPAKGLTGTGYDGHAFWDTEIFALPVLMLTAPDAAAHALRWRQSTLPIARDRARKLGLAGAAFPWRTISGEECSGYWPAGTAAFHVNAAIADAVIRFVDVTDDTDFEATVGLELLVETARLWHVLGHHTAGGEFRIDGVTGPDEYSALSDNNVYTNVMARRNLEAAADTAGRYPSGAAALGVDDGEIAAWRAAASSMSIPFDHELGVHPQAERFTQLAVWDFARDTPDDFPLMAAFPYFDLYRKQVLKQADLVLALQLCPDVFDLDQKRRDFDYYEPLTVRDSSLSAATQAIVAAEVGHLELAHRYLAEAALIDLDDLHGNAGDGLHIGSLAGAWMVIVAGFGGFRHVDGRAGFAPRLPKSLDSVRFGLRYRGRTLSVSVRHDSATYELRSGPPITIEHHGEPFELADDPVERPVPTLPRHPEPTQPPGREPMRAHRPPPVA